MVKIEVVPFHSGQEALVAQIHNDGFGEWIRKLGRTYAYRQISPQDVLNWIQNPGDTLWLAYVNGIPAGYVHCRIEEIEGQSNFLHLLYELTAPNMGQSRIAVVPEHRRKGVATALISTTLEHFKSQGVEIATVFAYSDNTAASALLTSLGFTHSEYFYFDRYSDKEPFVFDTIYAELDLRQPLKNVRLNPDVRIRAPREDDLESLMRIFGECSPWVYGPNPSAQQVLGWLREPWGEVTLVAEYEGKAVGAMEFSKDGVLGIPGVLPEYQNKGIGTTLFYHLLKRMQQRGHSKAIADTGIMQQNAIKMYHRLGFHIARRLWGWVNLGD